MYYGARYYDPRTSVWQSPDPILDQYIDGQPNNGVFDPRNLGLYTYTVNNPVNMVDPDGEFFWFAAALIVGTASYANAPENETDVHTGPTEAAAVLPLPAVGAMAKVVPNSVKTQVANIASSATSKIASSSILKSGSWITTKESMSKAAAKYQSFITGRSAQESFLLNGVKFDGVKKGILVDAKSGYGNFVNKKTGEFHNWFKGKKGLIDQARRQLGASEGKKIHWYFENKSAMEATQKAFDKANVKGIELIHKAEK